MSSFHGGDTCDVILHVMEETCSCDGGDIVHVMEETCSSWRRHCSHGGDNVMEETLFM